MGSDKAQELRALLGVAIALRRYAESSDDLADIELFLSAALALEGRASRLAFGDTELVSPVSPPVKINILC